MTTTTEHDVREQMRDAMYEAGMTDTAGFEDTGVMTNDVGFTVMMADGSEFQVTVQQSK